MKIRDVLVKFNSIVPFPWTASKIQDAGFDPKILYQQFEDELNKCEDVKEGTTDILYRNIFDLKKNLENP